MCGLELPDLDALAREYRDEPLLVFAIHGGEPAEQLEDFVAQTGLTLPLVRDEGTLYQFDYPSGTGYPYPRDVIVGRDGTVRSIKNSFNPDEARELVESLLAE